MTETFRAIGRRLSNWGRWGPDDELGTLNLITPAARATAATLVRTGRSIPLGLPFDRDGPQEGTGPHQNPVHIMTRLGGVDADADADAGAIAVLDDAVFLHTRCATHVTALCHAAYDGLAYNGRPVEVFSRAGAAALGIETMRGGIQGRGVLLDLSECGGVIGAADLSAACEAKGVEVREGDALLLRTGWMRVFTRDGDRGRYLGPAPALALDVADWLHARGVAFLAVDTAAVETRLRCILLRDMGLPIGAMFDLEALAGHCGASGVWDFQFACLPLPITGGVGSPVAPVATF